MKRDDIYYMGQAYMQAQAAFRRGEVPVGAVIVEMASGKIIAGAGNAPIGIDDPTAHAEILAIREAAYKLQNYRLGGTAIYVTLEPCTMCAGAIAQARIDRLVFGASDVKGGAVINGAKFFESAACHHRPHVTGGILAPKCGNILKEFFKARRGRKNRG